MANEVGATEAKATGVLRTADTMFWMLGTKASCSVADVLGEITTQAKGDHALLEFAKETKLHALPRSQRYLALYLSGKGTDQYFPLADLLQDPGVRDIVKRHFSAPLSHRNGNLITIGQAAYADKDWKNSLGTYFIYYVDLGYKPNSLGVKTRYVLAWGEDTYQWAPDDAKRFTQCVHQAASRLQKLSDADVPRAATFKMLATDCVIDTSTGMPANALFLRTEIAQAELKKRQVIRAASQPMARGR